MALQAGFGAFLSLVDSRNKESNIPYRISQAAFDAWVAAANFGAQDATGLGQLFTRTQALSGMTLVRKGVNKYTYDDAVVPPAPDDNVYGFDKLAFVYRGTGTRDQVITIPGRLDTAYTVGSDGISVALIDGAAVEDWVTSMEAVVVGIQGGLVTVLSGRVAR